MDAWHRMPAGTGSMVNVPHMYNREMTWLFTLKLAAKLGVAAAVDI